MLAGLVVGGGGLPLVVTAGVVTAAADELLRLLGRRRADLAAGRLHWRRLLAPGSEGAEVRAEEDLRRQGWCRPASVELLRRDGLRVAALVGRVAVRRRPLRWTGVVCDLAPRRHAESAVRQATADLERMVAARTQALRAVVRDLGREVEKRRRLEREVLETAEREQRRIGEDLHDSLGQQLTALRYTASSLEERLRARRRAEARLAAAMGRQLERALALTRELAHGLYPVKPLAGGLTSALESLAASTSDLFPVACRFRGGSPVVLPDLSMAIHLYRIAQEAVTNAARHGRPRHVWIDLGRHGGTLRLVVTDDGVGLPRPGWRGDGLGLRLMEHRAAAIGAVLRVRRRSGGGTRVSCVLPAPMATVLVKADGR